MVGEIAITLSVIYCLFGNIGDCIMPNNHVATNYILVGRPSATLPVRDRHLLRDDSNRANSTRETRQDFKRIEKRWLRHWIKAKVKRAVLPCRNVLEHSLL